MYVYFAGGWEYSIKKIKLLKQTVNNFLNWTFFFKFQILVHLYSWVVVLLSDISEIGSCFVRVTIILLPSYFDIWQEKNFQFPMCSHTNRTFKNWASHLTILTPLYKLHFLQILLFMHHELIVSEKKLER